MSQETPTHFYSLHGGLGRGSIVRIVSGTLLFLFVVISCAVPLLYVSSVVFPDTPDFVVQLMAAVSFALALFTTTKVGRWVFRPPVSCLLDFDGTRVRYRQPTSKEGGFKETWFENRGLVLAGAKGQDHLVRTSEGQTLRMTRSYLERKDLACEVFHGDDAELMVTSEGWCLSLANGVLALVKVDLRDAVASGLEATAMAASTTANSSATEMVNRVVDRIDRSR